MKFEHGLNAHMMAIDGTWHRSMAIINDISDGDANYVTVNVWIEGLSLRRPPAFLTSLSALLS